MSSSKRKKSRHSKKKQPSPKISETKPAPVMGDSQRDKMIRYVLSGLLVVYLLYYLFQLYVSLENTFFWADENKHAYICSLVSETHQIPAVLPDDLYGGYRWSYPPLFHLLGGAFMGLAGDAALKLFNLILLCVFLPAFYFLIRKHYGGNTAFMACVLLTLAPVLAINTVRFTAEMLSMLCIFFSFFFLMVALKKADKILAVISGIFTAMLMLSKQTGFVVFGFYSLLLLWFFWKNRQNFRVLLWVLGAAVLTYSPYLIWALYHKIEILGFVSVFLGITEKPEWSASALKVFQRYDSGIVEFLNLYYKSHGLLLIVLLIFPVYYFVRIRFKDEPQNIVLLLFLFLVLVMIAWHITNDRHTIILLPLSAFLVGYTVNQVITQKLIVRVMMMSLLLYAGYLTYHLPNYRQPYNAPDEFVELAQFIKKSAAPDARILSLSKFDVIMYTQNPVIWPHAKLRDVPIEIFEKQAADELYALFKKYGIKYIVLDIPRIADMNKFSGGRYPLYFARNCEKLERSGQLAFETKTKLGRFFLLSVN
jgi:4-amino-4-deoxy-L-arabinose transferase-like glycosyltransferase